MIFKDIFISSKTIEMIQKKINEEQVWIVYCPIQNQLIEIKGKSVHVVLEFINAYNLITELRPVYLGEL